MTYLMTLSAWILVIFSLIKRENGVLPPLGVLKTKIAHYALAPSSKTVFSIKLYLNQFFFVENIDN